MIILQVFQRKESLTDFFNFLSQRQLSFDFNYETSSELVFDVLRSSEALEYATLNHNTHLGR